MRNTRIIFFSILVAILLAILIMWCADVLAHGEGKCQVVVGRRLQQIEHLSGADLDGHLHGHRYMENGEQVASSHSGVYLKDGVWVYDNGSKTNHAPLDDFQECGTRPKPPQTQPQSGSTSTSEPRSSSTSISEPIAVVLGLIIKDDPEPSVDIEIPEPPTPPPAPELVRWEHQFYQGWNLVSFPVLPEGVATLSDLYHHWTFFTAHNGHIVVNLDGEWTLYSGADGEVTGDIPLSAHLGLAVRLDWATYLGVRGVALSSAETIDLHAGTNLVGFPEIPTNFKRPSDFLSDIICAVIVTRRGGGYLVGSAGDSGDEALERGDAVILIATEPTTISLATPQAPSAMRHATLITSWGAMK